MGLWGDIKGAAKGVGGRVVGYAKDSALAPLTTTNRFLQGDYKGAALSAIGATPVINALKPPTATNLTVRAAPDPNAIPGGALPQAGRSLAAAPAAPGILDTPGYGEKYYTDNKDRFAQPTKSSQYYDSTKSYYTTPGATAANTNSAYSKYMKEMSDPGRGTERAYDISDQLGRATQGENNLRDLSKQLQPAGQGEQYYDQTKDFYGQTGMGEQYISDSLGEYGGPGVAESNYDDIEADYDHFVGDLRGPSASEDLFNSGKGEDGLTTYFSREREKSQRALDDAMAARGLFGGEASLRGTIDLNEGIAAQQAKAMADMAAQSDAAKLGRTGEARQFGGMRTGAADIAQRSKMARVQSGIDNSVTGQGLATDRITRGQGAANDVASGMLDRIMGGGELEGKIADTEIDRLLNSGELGITADNTERQRNNDLLNGSMGVDKLNLDFDQFGLDKVQAGQGAAGDTDSMEISRDTTNAAIATGAQNSLENRERGALNDIAGVTGSMTDSYTKQANAIVDDWMASEEQKIQADLDAGQITQEGANARRQENQRQAEVLTKTLIEGVQAYKGGK